MENLIPITKPWIKNVNEHNEFFDCIESIEWKRISNINGKYFMIASDSGIFFEISKKANDELARFEVSRNPYVISKKIQAELESLIKVGAFQKKPQYQPKNPAVSSLNLNICHYCNLYCDYCFAEKGTYGDNGGAIKINIAKEIICLFLQQLPENGWGNIVLFGGEPLLEKSLIKEILRYGREQEKRCGKYLQFDLFTNGTLIDKEFLNWFQADKNIRLLVSMDGAPEMNDAFRHGEKGTGKLIEGNLRELLSIDDKRIVVRATLSEKEPKLTEKSEYFTKLGALNIVFEPAYTKGNEKIDDIADIFRGIEEELTCLGDYLLNALYNGRKINISVISSAISDILQSQRGKGNCYVPCCPAGRTYLSVDIRGDIYPCHYFNRRTNFKLGNVKDGYLPTKNMITDNGFQDLSKKNNRCSKCLYKSVCSGLCPFRSLLMEFNKKEEYLQEAYCKLMDMRYKEALRILSSFYSKMNYPYVKDWYCIIQTENKRR
ncbi:MAG TPA: SPASM domain-containing protein [Candidatus Pacearchaeota archaeon]|nr:SPASM domain-containing protein [Candidatus Pacearchaeota archaeon]